MGTNRQRPVAKIDDAYVLLLKEKVDAVVFSSPSIEDHLEPVSVMFWYKLIELIGEISNQAENMGDRLMLFIAR